MRANSFVSFIVNKYDDITKEKQTRRSKNLNNNISSSEDNTVVRKSGSN